LHLQPSRLSGSCSVHPAINRQDTSTRRYAQQQSLTKTSSTTADVDGIASCAACCLPTLSLGISIRKLSGLGRDLPRPEPTQRLDNSLACDTDAGSWQTVVEICITRSWLYFHQQRARQTTGGDFSLSPSLGKPLISRILAEVSWMVK